MIRLALVLTALVTLVACTGGAEGRAWYEQGDANYDSLKAAHDACLAKGGDYQLKAGGDPTHLGDYECQAKGK